MTVLLAQVSTDLVNQHNSIPWHLVLQDDHNKCPALPPKSAGGLAALKGAGTCNYCLENKEEESACTPAWETELERMILA